MKNTILIKEHSRRNLNSLDEAGDWINELEEKVENNSQKQQVKKKRTQKNEEVLRELQDNMKWNNIHMIGIPEWEEEEQGTENLFEQVMIENFPNLIREKATWVQETEGPSQEEPEEAHSIIVKMAKFQDKERILKPSRKKQEVRYKRY